MLKYSFFGTILGYQSKILTGIPRLDRQMRWTSTLRRSLLYLSENQMNNLERVAQLTVDCVVLDCEDKEPTQEKKEVRKDIKQFLDDLDVSNSKAEWCVKVNPVQAHKLCDADLAAILSARNLPGSICLPKIYNPDQLQWFAERIWNHLIKRPENSRGPLKLLLLIESAKAMLNLPELCKKAEELATMAPIYPVGLVLGNSELMQDLGANKTLSGLELLYIREKFVLVAKAFGLQAIDRSYSKGDRTSFKERCKEGVDIGFTGKQVFNTSEAVTAQDVFIPSRSKVRWAKTVLKKYHKGQDMGELNFENFEVDSSTLRQAKHVVNVAISVGKIKDEMEDIRQEE